MRCLTFLLLLCLLLHHHHHLHLLLCLLLLCIIVLCNHLCFSSKIRASQHCTFFAEVLWSYCSLY